MNPEDFARFGVEGEWSMATRRTIRWADCDMYAHVNHSAYLVLFEDLRVAWWLQHGGTFAPDAPGPVVGTLEVKYARAAGFGDEVLLTARCTSFRRTSFVHEYALWRDGLMCHARALCVVINNATGEKHPLPDEMRRALLQAGAKAEG